MRVRVCVRVGGVCLWLLDNDCSHTPAASADAADDGGHVHV